MGGDDRRGKTKGSRGSWLFGRKGEAKSRRGSGGEKARKEERGRRKAKRGFLLFTFLPFYLFTFWGLSASDPNAVLKAIVDNQRGGTMRATLTLSVARPDRQTQYVLDIVSDGNQKTLTRVKAPAKDAGQAFLRDGENILLYNPTLGRVLRLPPSGRPDSFLGADLSYSDLDGRDAGQD